MILNYLKIAWRNLLKRKVYSFINIFGLGIGMACCLLIFMFVQDELSYDTYHEHQDKIYRVIHGSKNHDSSEFWVWENAAIGKGLRTEFPEIDKVVQFSGKADILLQDGDKLFQEEGIFFMDSTALEVFSWELLRGNPSTALSAPYSIVLSESTARKYFGEEDAFGRTLEGSDVAGRAEGGTYTVTGIIKDIPDNSHLKSNLLISLSTYRQKAPRIFEMWGYADFYTYFKVHDHFDQSAFEQKMAQYLENHGPTDRPNYEVRLESMNDIYLQSAAQRQPGETGNLSNLYVFSVIGIFILILAVINFMNLSTARSMERAKEVGIRKSIGANRRSLVFQFLSESFFIVTGAALVALAVLVLFMPLMVDLVEKELALKNMINWENAPLLLGVFIGIGLLAGAYPSMVLSAFKPVSVLKGIGLNNSQGESLKKGLVVFQFSLSIALIAGTVIVYHQMSHLQQKDMGFDKERMLVLDYNYDEQVNDKREVLKNKMEANPEILSAAFSRSVPGSYFPNAGTEIEDADGEMKMREQPVFQVGEDFITHYGLEMAAGRPYSRDYPSDMEGGLIINEAAARSYGYSNPEDIIGKKFDQWGRSGEIIGVVKDFNFTSLHREIEPLTLPLVPYASRYMSLKVKSNDLARTLQEVEETWIAVNPHRPFLYSFLDDDFNRQYQSDFRFKKLFTVFSILAILIACLGLLGLATYTAEKRIKEIGIRKVMGANTSGIVALLSKDFIKLVGIAIIIASPISWYAMNMWLEGFAYRIDISWWVFPLAGSLAILIALLTVSSQAIKAAMMNPVRSLRSE